MKRLRGFVIVFGVAIVLLSESLCIRHTSYPFHRIFLNEDAGIEIGFFSPPLAYAQDGWKKEFEEICSKTDESMSLTKEGLKNLIDRCDKLKPVIEATDESAKKVLLKRLQMCKDVFKLALESKE